MHRLCRKSEIKDEKTELKEEDEFELVKQDQESEDDDKGEAKEEADIRDIRYNLETLSSNNHIIFFLLAVRHHTKASVKSVDLYLNLLYIDPVRPAHSGKTCLQRTKTWR